MPLIDLFVHVKMEAECEDLFECHILLLFAENLSHNLGRLPELGVLLLVKSDIVVSFEIVERGWNDHHRNQMHPCKLEATSDDKESADCHDIEKGRWRPQELMVKHLHDS